MRAAKHRTNMQGYSCCRFCSCSVCVCVVGCLCMCVIVSIPGFVWKCLCTICIYIHFQSSIHLVSYSICLKLPLKQLMRGLFRVAAPAADENHARRLYQCSAAPDLWPFNSCWSQGSGQGHLQQFHVHGQICGGLKTGSGLNIATKASCSNSGVDKTVLALWWSVGCSQGCNLAVDKTVLVWTLWVDCSQGHLRQLDCGQNCACVNTVSELQLRLPAAAVSISKTMVAGYWTLQPWPTAATVSISKTMVARDWNCSQGQLQKQKLDVHACMDLFFGIPGLFSGV